MVLAPGTYHNFTVEYSLYDQKTAVAGTVTKNYGELTFYAGKNKKVAADLAVPHYASDIYYMWDAAVDQHIWKGHENEQLTLNDEKSSNYPKVATDSRWYNTAAHPTAASRSAANCPNANEIRWYVQYGDPHWDSSIWSITKHLYAGGMWLKKGSVIAADQHKTLQNLKDAAPDGKNYTNGDNNSFKTYDIKNTNIKNGKPANLSNYIYFPAVGLYIQSGQDGQLKSVGSRAFYWSSTARPYTNLIAYNLLIEKGKVAAGYGARANAHCLWPK